MSYTRAIVEAVGVALLMLLLVLVLPQHTRTIVVAVILVLLMLLLVPFLPPRTSENTIFPGTWVNKGKKKGRGPLENPNPSSCWRSVPTRSAGVLGSPLHIGRRWP